MSTSDSQSSTTTSSDAAREAASIAVLVRQADEHFEHEGRAIVYKDSHDRLHLETAFIDYVATIIAASLPSTEATQAAEKQQLHNLDPLEFWQDLAEALGHPRPAKADVPALVSEVAELRGKLATDRADTEVTQVVGDTGEVERLRRELDDTLRRVAKFNDLNLTHAEQLAEARTRLATARADAIRECVERAAGAVKPVGSALGHHYRRAFNEGVQAAVWALESLTKGEGDDAETSS